LAQGNVLTTFPLLYSYVMRGGGSPYYLARRAFLPRYGRRHGAPGQEQLPVHSRGMPGYGATERAMPPSPLKSITPMSAAKNAVLTQASLCCGCEPPGGWFGPFGMLRLVAIVFFFLAGFGGFALYMGIVTNRWQDYVSAGLLIAAALVASLAASTHEGLMKQVDDIKYENAKYENTIENMKTQIHDLHHVENRLASTSAKYQASGMELDVVIDRLNFYRDVEDVSTILKSYAYSDYVSGDKNRILYGRELTSFMYDCGKIIAKAVPGVSVMEVHRAAESRGLSMLHIMIIVNAMVLADDPGEGPDRAEALLKLLLFALDPHRDARLKTVLEALGPLLRHSPEYSGAGLRQELFYLQQLAGDMDQVPEEALQKLTFAAFYHPKPTIRELLVSRGVVETALS